MTSPLGVKRWMIGPVEVEIPGAMREHFTTGLKTKDPGTSFIAIHDTTLDVRQADGRNVLIEQDAKILFPRMLFFLINSAPVTGTKLPFLVAEH
jgi:hypothetical protein